jgi:hypothetical protein
MGVRCLPGNRPILFNVRTDGTPELFLYLAQTHAKNLPRVNVGNGPGIIACLVISEKLALVKKR